MTGLSVKDGRREGVTPISNRFIDRFLPEANGEFVKVYLLLLRRVAEGGELSVSYMADKLNHTEKDVLRALKYWEKISGNNNRRLWNTGLLSGRDTGAPAGCTL